ncbi:MAG: IS66 family transposase [Spirochaetaceae bacterium]|nr:IS66 family transposase [Spirochaetaceae bacterium]
MGLREGILQTLPAQAREYIHTVEQQAAGADLWRRRHDSLERRYNYLKEEYRLLVYKRFARSAEQIDPSQEELFAEAETESQAEETSEETLEVAAHTRKKRGRKPLDENLPRVEILHDIAEEEKHCACGHELVRIGQEESERLAVIPEQMWVERHIRPKYACKHCEGSGDEEKPAVRIAPVVPSILPGSILTPGLLAFILVNKFCDHLPFYRQEKRFERLGIHICRQDMSNWTIAAATRLRPLVELFRALIRAGPVVQMDETPVQVLHEPGRPNTRKSYMWLARGGPPGSPVLLYTYRPTRGAGYPTEFLAGYQGYLQTDGYPAYDRVAEAENGITHVGCWAHLRRKFFDAAKASKKTGAAQVALGHISTIYRQETELRSKYRDKPEAFLAARRKEIEPLLATFKDWLGDKTDKVVPSTLLGKAVGYGISQWDKLVGFLDQPYLTPDTNAAENAIRPFVVGRKNWLFSGSPRGADSSCAIYSLIETAKQNGVNPYAYLHYLFTEVLAISTDEQWAALLPANINAEHVNSAFLATVR